MCSSLKNRKQRTQINNYFGSGKKGHFRSSTRLYWWTTIIWPFINDLVLFLVQYFLSNYAKDNNLYNIGNNLELSIIDLQTDFRAITNWFFEIYDTELWEEPLYVHQKKLCRWHIYIQWQKNLKTARKKHF